MLDHRRETSELMDDPALPPAIYQAVLSDLASVNSITLAHRPTLNFLYQALGKRKEFTLLDVGFGQGDMLRAIAQWAKNRGITAHLTGIDINPGSAPTARAATDAAADIEYRTGDYRETGLGFDFIVSSLVAHHMSADELRAFLRVMESEARLGWMVNDLHRHRLAHFGFPILARVMRWHEIVRADGTLSIARSFRPADWRAILADAGIAPDAATIARRFPFRLCVERIR